MKEPSVSREELLTVSQLSELPPPLHLGSIASSNPELVKSLESFDPLQTAVTMGGLLTVPDLQSNCVRLESLVHLGLAFGRGKRTPNEDFVRRTFSAIGRSMCGAYEDPAEDVFVTSISTRTGNFRVLEGIWESAGFFLQRIVHVVEDMPDRRDFNDLRASIYALLRLSDLVCDRAKLVRYQLGHAIPVQVLPRNITEKLGSLRRLVKFSEAELEAAGISIEQLSQFCFDPRKRGLLLDEVLGHSTLERYPVVWRNKEFLFVLPTATSAAIRRFILQHMDAAGMREVFLNALALEYGKLFSNTPLLGGKFGAPLEFRRTPNALVGAVTTKVDLGRYLNFVFFVDTLEDFERTGLAGTNPDPTRIADDLDRWIDHTYEAARNTENFVNGLTILVGCGIGRGVIYHLNNKDRPHWRIEFLSAPDLETLSWTPEFKALSLWQVLDAQDKLTSFGVELANVNGLLNMIAWTRSLEGHLVPHGELPDDFGHPDMQSLVLVTQNSLRDLRYKVLETYDPHVEQDVQGHWVSVRKEGESHFGEDRARPLYVVLERPVGRRPSAVFVSALRSWWCTIEVTEGTTDQFVYERWKMLTVWLARAAPVLEQAIDILPAGPILWKVKFEGDMDNLGSPAQRMTLSDARARIVSHVDPANRTVSTTAAPEFEHAHFNEENIYERALVETLVAGVASLARRTLNDNDRAALVDMIVPDTSARQTHAFLAQGFRDFVKDTIPRNPITISEYDSAFVKLGLGWRVRGRAEGAYVEGKADCMAFLNKLVRSLEDELCADLQKYDRVATIEFSLRNHEAAIVNRDWWRRTAAAVLSLHDDKNAALAAMAKHEFALNGVLQATRLLVEIGLCECPFEAGRKPGQLDLSRLMAKAAQIFHLGGWSDAIRWDVMEPRLRVTPLGDVHANLDFIDDIISPFSRTTHGIDVANAVEKYSSNLEERAARVSVEDEFEADFCEAWKEESGASLDDIRNFVDFIEDLGIRDDKPIVRLPKSALSALSSDKRSVGEQALRSLQHFLTFASRSRWREIPAGFDEKDIQPWRFRRRLSILRKPLIQVNDTNDPLLVVAPGLLRDAMVYMVGGYHRGDFPDSQLRGRMLSWSGKRRDARGKAFNIDAANRLKELGWFAEHEVKVTKLLGRGFEQDFGDVDVLAWKPSLGRVLVLECKDVQYRKTYGEIAEQVADFRGEVAPNGKPDHLLRHLNRIDIISKHLTAVAKYVGMATVHHVESHLVFRNPVPMKFALRRMAQRVAVHVFDELEKI